jgi:5-methylcytosine-specific restriction protein A
MAWPTTSRQSRGYGAEHDRMRALLKRTVVTCEECERRGRVSLGCRADHIVPLAKGGTGERSNYQWLCIPCHDVKSAAEKLAEQGVKAGVNAAGRPTDPNHPWNRRSPC